MATTTGMLSPGAGAGASKADSGVSEPPGMMEKLSNYIIVDIGASLTNKKFSRDLDAVIQRAREAGVTKIMVTGTSLHSTKEALRLTRLYPGTLYSTAGQQLQLSTCCVILSSYVVMCHLKLVLLCHIVSNLVRMFRVIPCHVMNVIL